MKKAIIAVLAVLLLVGAVACNGDVDEQLLNPYETLKITSLSYEKDGDNIKITATATEKAKLFYFLVGTESEDNKWKEMNGLGNAKASYSFNEKDLNTGVHFIATTRAMTKAAASGADEEDLVSPIYDASGWPVRKNGTIREYLFLSEGYNYYNCIFEGVDIENSICSGTPVKGSLEKGDSTVVFKANSAVVYSFYSAKSSSSTFSRVSEFITAANSSTASTSTAYTSTDNGSTFEDIEESICPQLTGIEFDATEATVSVGGTAILKINVTPSNATPPTIIYTSSDTKVATVDKDGVVTGVAEGTATITATSKDDSSIKATCTVTVSTAVAKISTSTGTVTYYKKLSDAFKAVKTSEAITLLCDVKEDVYFNQNSQNIEAGFDLDGHTLNGSITCYYGTLMISDGTIKSTENHAITCQGGTLFVSDVSIESDKNGISADGNIKEINLNKVNISSELIALSVNGPGTETVTNQTIVTVKDCSMTASGLYCIKAEGKTAIIIDGGTYTNNTKTTLGVITINSGITVNDGKFSCPSNQSICYRETSNYNLLKIKGGLFTQEIITDFLETGYKCVELSEAVEEIYTWKVVEDNVS